MNGDTTPRDAVLIPTRRQTKSYGFMRALNRKGIHTIVAADCEWIPHAASRYCSELVRIPPYTDDLLAYRDALLEIASRPEVKVIVPIRECDIFLLAKYQEAFEDRVSFVVPDLQTLRRGHDRLQLANEAATAGVPFAETRALSEVDEWDKDVVVKARYNILTDEYIDSFGPSDAEEINHVRFFPAGQSPDVDVLREEMHHDPIVQDFIPEAKKHLYCALWEHGEPRATYQHEQIRKTSWVGGGGVYRESTYSPDVEAVAYDLLSHLDWHGLACIEYLKDERTGEWKFLELNPRVWHSLPEAVRVGVDFPTYYWRCARSNLDAVEDTYQTGVRHHVSFGELKHFLSLFCDDSPLIDRPSVARTGWEIMHSCLTNPRFDLICRDDPQFFLSAICGLGGMEVGNLYGKQN